MAKELHSEVFTAFSEANEAVLKEKCCEGKRLLYPILHHPIPHHLTPHNRHPRTAEGENRAEVTL